MGRNIFFRVFVGLTVGMLGPVWGSPIGVTSGMSDTIDHDTTGGLFIVASVSGNPTGTFSGLFSGAGKLTIGNGTLPVTVDLTNLSNSYSGGTDVLSGSTVIVLQGTSATPGAAIAGGTPISLKGGTIKFQMSGGATPTITNTITLTGGGTLSAIGSGAVYQYSPIHGTGGLTIGEGAVTFSGANNYTGGTTVASGATLHTSASTIPSSDTDGITLSGGVVNFTSAGTYDGSVTLVEGTTSTISCSHLFLNGLTGTGGLTVPSGSEIIIVSEASYTGPTKINGLLWIATSSFGSSSVTCNNSLTFQYDGSFGGGVSGTGVIVNTTGVRQLSGQISGGISTQIAGGTLWLQNSTNNYSGGNLMQGSSTLKGTSGSISGDVTFQTNTTENTLIFTDSDADGTFEGSFSGNGTGTVSFEGTKTLTISNPIPGNAGASSTGGGTLILGDTQTYTGSTNISGRSTIGFMWENDPTSHTSGVTFGSSNDVLDLSGMGNSNSPVFTTGGITAPSGATIKTILGSDGSCPVIDLKNTAISISPLNLELVLTDALSSYSSGQDYSLFTNIDGDSVVSLGTSTSFPYGLMASLESLSNGNFKFKLVKCETKNAHIVGGGHGATQNVSHSVNNIVTHGMGAARDNSGGGGEGGSFGNSTNNPFRAPSLTNDFLNMTDKALAHATQDNRRFWSPVRTEKTAVWVQPFGMTLRQASDGATPGYRTRTAGVLAGFDHKFRYDIIGGAAIGYARTNQNFDANAGKGNVKDKFLSLFGTWFRGPWYVEGSLLMGLERYQGVRNTGINNTFVSNHHGGYQFSPHVGGGYTFDVRGFKLKGFANVDFSYSAQYGYQENGTNGVYWNQSSATMLRTEVGGELSKAYEFTNVNWKPVLSLSGVNKKPLRKGTIVSPSAGVFESTEKTTTNISPGIASTWQFADGYSFSAAWTGEFGSQYSLQEAFLKFSKKL